MKLKVFKIILITALLTSLSAAADLLPGFNTSGIARVQAASTPSWNKGVVSVEETLSTLLDFFAKKFNEVNSNYTWDEANKKYLGSGPDGTVLNTDHNGVRFKRWGEWALLVGLDGTDAQVAAAGLPRDELLRRARLSQAYGDNYSILSKIDDYTPAQWQNAINNNVPVSWNAARTVPVFQEGSTPNRFAISGFMDYGNSKSITMRVVPQDYIDPRIIGGKPIKDWFATWENYDTDNRVQCDIPGYAPDFSSEHHGMVNFNYAQCPYRDNIHYGHLGDMFAKLLDAIALPDHYTNPNGHMDENAIWSMIHTDNKGWAVEVMGLEYCPTINMIAPQNLSSVYGSAAGQAFAARTAQMVLKFDQPRGKWDTDAHHVTQTYLMLRLLGGNDTMNYATASRTLDGAYHYRYHVYGVHRTPDKLVSVTWSNITSGPVGTYIDENESSNNLTRQERAALSKTDTPIVMVIPNNDNYLPDDETYLLRPYGGMVGKAGTLCGTEINHRFDMTDAVMSTAAEIPLLHNQYNINNIRARQYQSMTSFYDKTAISLVSIYKGPFTYGPMGSWVDGFGNSFYADPEPPVFAGAQQPERRDLYFEGGMMDLNDFATSKDTSLSQDIDSPWWCVNDRLGVATIGGSANGKFAVRNILGDQWATHGVLVGWNEPLPDGTSEGTKLVDMTAAYFTDTPANVVRELQTKLISLDSQLPQGWKGAVSGTPDGQRVMALARFFGENPSATVSLSFPEGAPVFESLTTVSGGTGTASFNFEKLQSMGQTLAFYVSGGVTQARQIGDLEIQVKGSGTGTIKYLSRANSNTVYINGTPSTRTKSQLANGISVSLTSNWTTIRVTNNIDDDHAGPAVEIKYPQFYNDEQVKYYGGCWGEGNVQIPDPYPVVVPGSGLTVKIDANDRSGVEWVDVYLDWNKIDRLENAPYEITIPKSNLPAGIHALYAVACDRLGNVRESFTVPFEVVGGAPTPTPTPPTATPTPTPTPTATPTPTPTPTTPPQGTIYRFDFNTSTSPTAEGFTGVTNTTVYTAELGYGWNSNVGAESRSTGGDLYRDIHYYNHPKTFSVDLANGDYTVTLHFAHMSNYDHGYMDIKAEGVLKLEDIDTVPYEIRVEQFNVTVTDGQLNIEISSDKALDPNWIINGLEIAAN